MTVLGLCNYVAFVLFYLFISDDFICLLMLNDTNIPVGPTVFQI